MVNRLSHYLLSLKITKGGRVACLLENSIELLELFFACSKTGAIFVPLNYRLAGPELVYMLNDSDPRLLVYAAGFHSKVRLLTSQSSEIRHYLPVDENPSEPGRTFDKVIAGFSENEPAVKAGIEMDDPLLLLYTSGSTGTPKGALLSHQNILFSAIHSLVGYGINQTYKSLIAAPLFHVSALLAGAIPVIYAGGCLVIMKAFNPLEALDLIEQEKINYMFAVPVMYQLMSQAGGWEAVDMSHVHFFIAGGASLPVSLIHKYHQDKGIYFAQGYGLTETGRLSALTLEDSIRKAGSVGKEVFHVTMRIVDENDRDVPPGQIGEIIVKGPNVFLGYWHMDEANEAAFKNGWFHTADLGRRDEEGFLYIIGRKQEMLIFSGENIYPAEIEKVIQSLPGVKEVAVIGKKVAKKGDVAVAFISLKDGETLTKKELIHKLQGKIADFKIPREVFFLNELPRNSLGKIDKLVLKRKLQEET
ncbi:MAG: AMP-binding protein [Desulfobacterales bacterium]|nr:AMP-binding protein [Desulfobacterales bacterium]